MGDWKKIDPALQDKVYRPKPDERYDVDEDLADPEGFGD